MQMTELLDSVQYITDQYGKKKGVLLDLNVWQALMQLVEQNAVSDPIMPIKEKQLKQAQGEAEQIEPTAEPQREAAMQREEAAFRRLHATLYKQHAGQYVAIYNEQLIDSDTNQVALYRRVRQQHPGEFVWVAPVHETPDEVLVFRSPRLQNGAL